MTDESVSSKYAHGCSGERSHADFFFQAGRDITNLSKKTIFLLHRLALEGSGSTAPGVNANKEAAKRGYEKLREVQELYCKLQPELLGDNFWRYQRQVSPGLQEYIEALSFAHYLDHGTLITFDEVQRTLTDPQGVEVRIIECTPSYCYSVQLDSTFH